MNFQTVVEQFPTVFASLNVGFLQTLKLFFITLLGAIPLGLIISFGSMSRFKPLSALVRVIVWIFRGTPLMLQIMIIYFFPGLVFHNNIWGSGENGRLLLIKDSYGNTFVQFPVEDYAEVHVLDLRFFKGDVTEYAKENGITDVLVLYGTQNFIKDTSLQTAAG